MVDLYTLAEAAVRSFQIVAPANLYVRVIAQQAPLPQVLGLPDRLAQVFDNLIGNAIKFSPHGGEILVSFDADEHRVVTSVADQGIGIPSEEQSRIWERFYQADHSLARKYGGMGLGLSIVQKIIELHGGWVDVISEPGVGSVFRFALPIANAVPATSAPAAAAERGLQPVGTPGL